MALAEIEDLLKRTMGLDVASVGRAIIERGVRRRATARGLSDLDDYWRFLNGSASELAELIEVVVVPETWFFREAESFAALGRLVVDQWLPANPQSQLRALSVPCSSGEEPYSIAMTLLSRGVSAARFHVQAVDISARVLLQAERALYGRNSFRGAETGFRDRFFTPTPEGYLLGKAVTGQVTFQPGNLLAEGFLPGLGLYDVVFCRNVLIYFDRATQDRAIRVLDRLLAASGWLFVGPAEGVLLLNHNFVPAKVPLAFAFRKPPAATATAHVQPRLRQPAVLSRKPPQAVRSWPSLPRVNLDARRGARGSSMAVPAAPMEVLDRASQLADAGRLRDAAKLCEEYLGQHPSSARAFYLLGVVTDAGGDLAKANEYYRRAIYLDPHHFEALMHLAYSTEKLGDPGAAKSLRARARRAKEGLSHG